MKLSVEYSRLANKYFFITNLAEVDPFIRKNYNDAYLMVIGELNEKQKTALKEYKSWYNNLNAENEQERKRITQAFYHEKTEDEIWTKYSNIIGISDIQLIFSDLEKQFSLIWQKFEPVLKIIKTKMEADFPKQDSFIKIWEELSIFYNTPEPEKMIVSLIICPINHFQGGKVVDAKTISIEVSKIDIQESMIRLWLLFIHEVIHSNFEKEQYKKRLHEFIKKQAGTDGKFYKEMDVKNIFREMITSSLAARGYIAERFFNIDIVSESKKALIDHRIYETNKHVENIQHWARLNLRETLKEYFEEKKSIDEKFLQKAWDVLAVYEKASRN